LGITYQTYRRHALDGEKWCSGHKRWHSTDDFDLNRPRNTMCRAWRREYMRDYDRVRQQLRQRARRAS
jgi:hypothetical protein